MHVADVSDKDDRMHVIGRMVLAKLFDGDPFSR